MKMQKITLNLIPKGNKPIVYASQFDNDRVIRFDLMEGEADYIYSNSETFSVSIRKPDDRLVTLEATKDSEIITVDDEPVTVYFVKCSLTDQACACFGEAIGELKITEGETLIGTINFVLVVERSPELNGITSADGIHDLTEQIEAITEEVIGENYYDKEEVDGLIEELEDDIPTKTSQLTNDSGYITEDDIPTIPTKTSQLQNDSGFITEDDIPTIPTKTSQLQNDSGFTTIDDSVTAPDKTWSSSKISNEIINILPTATASGNPANFTTSYALPLEFIKAYIVSAGGGGTPSNPIAVAGLISVIITKEDEDLQIVETVTISLGETVYGGYVTQDKAGHRQLVVSWAKKLLSSSDFNWRYTSTAFGYSVFYSNTNLDFISTNITTLKWLSEIFTGTAKARNNLSDNEIGMWNVTTNSNQIAIRCDSLTSLEDFSSAVQDYYLYYEMPYTITIPLADGDPVNALLGVNNFSTNSGDCEVTYKCSINEAINSAIASQSNRSVSLMRTSVPEDVIEVPERGEDNER